MNLILATFLLQGVTGTAPEVSKPAAAPVHLNSWLVVCGAVVAATIILLIWSWLAAPKSKRSRGHHRQHRDDSPPRPEAGASQHRRRRHRRGHGDDHLPRNPTLAETGGLPPLRDERPSQRP